MNAFVHPTAGYDATKFGTPRRPAEGLYADLNWRRAVETVTIAASSGVLEVGTVVGRITATGKWVPSPAEAAEGKEGAEIARGVIVEAVDATSEDQPAQVTVREASWMARALIYDASVDDEPKQAAKRDQLAERGVLSH